MLTTFFHDQPANPSSCSAVCVCVCVCCFGQMPFVRSFVRSFVHREAVSMRLCRDRSVFGYAEGDFLGNESYLMRCVCRAQLASIDPSVRPSSDCGSRILFDVCANTPTSRCALGTIVDTPAHGTRNLKRPPPPQRRSKQRPTTERQQTRCVHNSDAWK